MTVIKKIIKLIIKYVVLFVTGGLVYMSLEILWRGYTHWTMGVLGGICFICLGLINELLSWETPLVLQMLIGGAIITVLELVTGCIVNLWLGWNVWDYSDLPYNFLGQISLFSSIGWIGLSLVGIVLDDYLRYWLFHEEKPRYKWI